MDLNRILQIALKDAAKFTEQYIQQQKNQELANFIEANRTLIMARTINRLIAPQLVVEEFQQSLNELREYYCKEIYNDDEAVDSINELTGLAKSSAIACLGIADELEID